MIKFSPFVIELKLKLYLTNITRLTRLFELNRAQMKFLNLDLFKC